MSIHSISSEQKTVDKPGYFIINYAINNAGDDKSLFPHLFFKIWIVFSDINQEKSC